MRELRQLKVCTDYAELHEALRKRAEALGVNRELLAEICGLSYLPKVLTPRQSEPAKEGKRPDVRPLIPSALGPLLWGLGCVIALMEDPILTERHRKRPDWKPHIYNRNARQLGIDDLVVERIRQKTIVNSHLGQQARMKKVPSTMRKALARKAARSRWNMRNRREGQ